MRVIAVALGAVLTWLFLSKPTAEETAGSMAGGSSESAEKGAPASHATTVTARRQYKPRKRNTSSAAKRVPSEAQRAALAKAQAKRAENLAARKGTPAPAVAATPPAGNSGEE